MKPPETSASPANPELKRPNLVVIDADTQGIGWRSWYTRVVESAGGKYLQVDTIDQLSTMLTKYRHREDTSVVIILSGQQLIDGWQKSWLELIHSLGFQNEAMIITGFRRNSNSWNELQQQFGLPMIEKHHETFINDFNSFLEERSQFFANSDSSN